MCEIVGGIYVSGTDQIDTVIYGGNSVVVGQKAIDAMQDRALYLKANLTALDHKKLLGLIDMSQPISFGTIDSNDGETSFIVSRSSARATPSEKLMGELKTRLDLAEDKVAELLIRDLKLNRSVWMALGNTINRIIEQINASLKSRGKDPLDIIMITPALGHIIPFSGEGKLEVATDVRESDPKTYKALMNQLLYLAIKKKCVSLTPDSTEWKMPVVPEYPKLDVSLTQIGSSEHISVADYVTAIIKRENELTPYLVAIEKYYVEIAHGIQEYTKRIIAYIAS